MKAEKIGKLAPGQWSKPVEPRGTLHGPSTLFMSTGCGTASCGDEKFELLCGGWGAGPPMIRCERTNLTFTLSWTDLLNMALDAGITREHPDMAGK